MSLIFAFILLVHAVTGTSVLEIETFKLADTNTVELQCRENHFDGNPPAILRDVRLFLFNSTGQSVTSLLEDNGIRYDFDSNSEGKLSFEVQQSIEGYYYCSRSMSAGLPDDEDDYRTILAYPGRESVQTRHIKQVGDPVTLHCGVREGALAAHYSARWLKDTSVLKNDNVSREKDFSLHTEAVKLSDAGAYHCEVTISAEGGDYNIEIPTIILIVFESPVITRISEPVVIDEEESRHKNVSLSCVVTGEPSLRISWFIGTQNLTFANPSRYSINESIESDKRVRSTLTIRHPTYKDSGQYTCVSTILNDITGGKDFRAQENTTLTVLESNFTLRTVVTEHQQLQLWIELNVPLFDAVTAVVYFTLKEEQDIQQRITTHSVLTENTFMVFRLESHEIPERFQNKDFLVQVALQVGNKEGSVVPKNLEEASTSHLDNPTVDCSRDVSKYGVLVGIPLGIIAPLLTVIACLVYKSFKEIQKTKRRNNMDPAERERLENNIKEYLEALRDPSLDETKKRAYIEELKRTLNISRGLLVGDGPENDEDGDGSENDEEEDCLMRKKIA